MSDVSLVKNFFILQPNVLVKKKKLTSDEIKEKLPKDLVKNVSHYVGTLADKHVFYNKTIIIKAGPCINNKQLRVP